MRERDRFLLLFLLRRDSLRRDEGDREADRDLDRDERGIVLVQ